MTNRLGRDKETPQWVCLLAHCFIALHPSLFKARAMVLPFAWNGATSAPALCRARLGDAPCYRRGQRPVLPLLLCVWLDLTLGGNDQVTVVMG